MRQPVMAALLLVMCFPVKGVIVMIATAAIGAAIPLPRAIAPARPQEKGDAESEHGAASGLEAADGAASEGSSPDSPCGKARA